MPPTTAVGRWCERVAEACWLLALTMVPLYFNLYSARHFEPDKVVTLRSLALVAIAAVLIRSLDRLIIRSDARPAGTTGPPAPGLWRRLREIPLALPTLLYAGVFGLTTLTSVVPGVSLWGSYQRMQGTYTALSYMLLAVAIVAVVRRRDQLERIVTLSLLTGAAVAGYGVLQHQGLDPLPWQGDVISRVASTMGNSIFVAAYMIMVVPLALYRLLSVGGASLAAAPAEARRGAELLWTLARVLLVVAGLALLLAMVKFGATIRTVDYRYWWLLPGAVACATAIWGLLTTGFDRPEGRLALWPGLMTLGYLLAFGLQFALSAGAGGVQAFASDGTAARAQDWWVWLLFAGAALTGAYGLALLLPRRAAQPTRLALLAEAGGAGAVLLLLLTATFFTQSRGPWLGLGAGLFVFVSLALWEGLRRARAAGSAGRARLLRTLLGGWVALILATGLFLLAFNLSDAPPFERLRQVPYLGRMGRLLEVGQGTGLVRVLIWRGDEHAGGSLALISSDPLRALIGWGPESMFVAFNPFYPPTLATVEARGASPDRAHQAQLDELVTRGVLGLASYLFLLLSFLALCWRLLRQSAEWRWQLFFIACLSAVVCHVVESLTGIPVVSTLMMFWVTLGMTVAGGALAGHYQLSQVPKAAVEPAPAEAVARQAPTRRRGQARSAPARGTPARATTGAGGQSGGALLAYGLIAAATLIAVVLLNLNPVRADMRFQQGQSTAQRAGLSLDALALTLDDYLSTVRLNPREDFYYLNLGRALMSLAEALRAQGVEASAPAPEASVEELLQLRDEADVYAFIQRGTPGAMLSYAEAVLLRAHDLNPRNKDHHANLGRLNSYWFRWSSDPARLYAALDWYEQVTPIAPQDVTLINERAGVLIALGDYARAAGDPAQAADYYAQASELLGYSAQLDPAYADTFVRLGDLARLGQGDLEAAVGHYVTAIRLSGNQVAGSIEAIAAALADRPDLILRLRDAYAEHTVARTAQLDALVGRDPAYNPASQRAELALLHAVTGLLAVRGGEAEAALEPYRRAAELDPASYVYSRNYALVLSDTLRHDQAIAETQRLIAALRGQAGAQQTIAESEQLIAIFELVR